MKFGHCCYYICIIYRYKCTAIADPALFLLPQSLFLLLQFLFLLLLSLFLSSSVISLLFQQRSFAANVHFSVCVLILNNLSLRCSCSCFTLLSLSLVSFSVVVLVATAVLRSVAVCGFYPVLSLLLCARR